MIIQMFTLKMGLLHKFESGSKDQVKMQSKSKRIQLICVAYSIVRVPTGYLVSYSALITASHACTIAYSE